MGRTSYVRVGIDATAAKAGASVARKSLQDIKNETEKTASGFDRMIGRVKSLKTWLFSMKGAFLQLGVGIFAAQLISAATNLDKMISSLAVATGSVAAARVELEFVRKVSAELGIAFGEAAQGFAKFSASVKGTAVAGEAARKVFYAVAQASSALGLSADDTNGMLVALSQIAGKGTASMEEIRQQLGERLPGALVLAARSMDMTIQAFSKAVAQGEILAEDLLPKLAAEMSKTFGDQAATGADRLQGRINAFKTAWFEFLNAINQNGASDLFKAAFTAMADGLGLAAKALPAVSLSLKVLAGAAAGYVTAVVAAKVATAAWSAVLWAQWGGMKAAIPLLGGLTGGIRALGVAIAANPIGALATALGAFVAIALVARGRMNDLRQAVSEAGSVQERYAKLLAAADQAQASAADRADILARRTDDLRGSAQLLQEQLKKGESAWGGFLLRLANGGSLVKTVGALNSVRDALREIQEATLASGIDAYLNRLKAQEDELKTVTDELKEKEKELAKARAEAWDKAEREAISLLSKYDETRAAMRNLGREMVELNKSWKDGHLSAAEYGRSLDGVKQKLEDLQAILPETPVPKQVFDTNHLNTDFITGTEEGDKKFYADGQANAEAWLAGIEASLVAYDADPNNFLKAFFASQSRDLAAESEAVAAQYKRDMAELASWTSETLIGMGKSLFVEVVSGGKVAWDEVFSYMVKTFASALADMFELWVRNQIKMAAIQKAQNAGVSVTNSATGTATNAATGAATTAATSNTSWLSSLGSWAGTAAGGATIAAVAGVAILVYANYFRKKRASRRDYDGSGRVEVSGGAFDVSGTNGKHRDAAGAIASVLSAFQDATGLFVKEMQVIEIKVRNSGGLAKAYFNGIFLGEFLKVSDAIVAAAKKAFLSSSIADQIDPIVRQAIEGYHGPAEEFGEAVKWVQDIVREANGFSDLYVKLQGLPQMISLTKDKLIEFGVSAADAMATASKWGIRQFQDAWRSLSGQQQSPKEELAQRKAEGALLIAQLKLWRLELEARKKYLEGQLKLARWEWGGGGGGKSGGGFRVHTLQAQESYLKAASAISQSELKLTGAFLRGRAKGVEGLRDVYQAELDVINEVLKAIDKLLGSINLDKIKLPGLGRGGGGLGGGTSKWEEITRRWEDAVKSLKEWLLGVKLNSATTALTPQQQVIEAKRNLDSVLGRAERGDVNALEQLQSAADQFLTLYKTFTGGGEGFLGSFADLFYGYIGRIEDLAANGKPSRDQKIVWDERFHQAQQTQIREAEALRQQSGKQTGTLIELSRIMVKQLQGTNESLARMRTTQQAYELGRVS